MPPGACRLENATLTYANWLGAEAEAGTGAAIDAGTSPLKVALEPTCFNLGGVDPQGTGRYMSWEARSLCV